MLDAIDTLKEREVTLIVIAHRPSVLRHVDKILVLREGAVQTFGPREEVIPQVRGPADSQAVSVSGSGE